MPTVRRGTSIRRALGPSVSTKDPVPLGLPLCPGVWSRTGSRSMYDRRASTRGVSAWVRSRPSSDAGSGDALTPRVEKSLRVKTTPGVEEGEGMAEGEVLS